MPMADILLPSDIDVALSGDIDVPLPGDIDLVTVPTTDYLANGVTFDGTNDFLNRGADLTGSTAGKLWTGSLWFKANSSGLSQTFYAAQTGVFAFVEVRLQGNNFFVIEARRSSTAVVLQMFFSNFTDTTSWHHLLWSADLTNPARRHLILDDVEVDEGSTHVNIDIDFLNDDHFVGSRAGGFTKADSDMADFWMFPGVYLDFSIEANRRLFRTSGGKPKDLGSDGSIPTGAAPLIYFSGLTAVWHTNKGTGGGFTENGALTDAPTSPSD